MSEITRRELARMRDAVVEALRERFDQATREGELSQDTNISDLASYYSILAQGMALQAQHGGSSDELLATLDVAMQAWPGRK